MAKKAMGRGLDSLFDDNTFDLNDSPETIEKNSPSKLKISDIEPNREQARKQFDEIALMELSDSIGRHGVIQPITVRRKANGYYEIIAGERRWRASKMAGLSEIPALIIEADDRLASELSLIENLQRENLNAAEEARGYRDLMDRFGLTQEEAAERVGKSRTAVANILRILKLPESVLSLVEDDSLSYGHARALIPLTQIFNNDEVLKHANIVINGCYSVRQTEQYVKSIIDAKDKVPCEEPIVSKTYYKKLENDMSEHLGRKTVIKRNPDGNGKLTLSFSGSDDLESLIKLICGNEFFNIEE